MKRISLILSIILISSMIQTIRLYHGGGASGIAWDYIGVEFVPAPAVFLCGGNMDRFDGHYTHNPLADIFPQLVTDC